MCDEQAATPVVEPTPFVADPVPVDQSMPVGKVVGPDTTETVNRTAPLTTKQTVENYLKLAAENSPPSVRKYVEMTTPVFVFLVGFVEMMIPICVQIYQKLVLFWQTLGPYKPDLLIPSFMGFVMCFFGGSYVTLIAAYEAFNMIGSDSVKRCVVSLKEDFQKVLEASQKDDTVDEDGDGVADVLQISGQQLATRKTLLFLRTVDPRRVTDAIAGITAGWFAVIATLKLQFARTITLGNSIANSVQPPVDEYVVPVLEKMMPEGYKKWAQPTLAYTVKTIAISIAWTIQRVISAFHSAVKGGLMFARNLIEYCGHMNLLKMNHEDTYLDEVVGYLLAGSGLYFQLSYHFALPFPLNILLFPFTLMEYFLIWTVSN